MALVRVLGKCSASRGASCVILCLECKPNVQRAGSVMIHRVYGDAPTFMSITGACALMIVHSVFSVMASLIVEMLFMFFSVYNTV